LPYYLRLNQEENLSQETIQDIHQEGVHQEDVHQAYDGSHIYFQFLRACGWGNLMNLGYSKWWDAYLYPFRSDIAQERLVHQSIALLDVQPRQQVVDVACGKGRSSFFLAMCNPEATIVGIDKIVEQTAIAKALYENTRNLSYMAGEAEALPFADQSVDRVHCLEAAFHFDRAQFLKEVDRVLKPSGRVVIVDFMWKNASGRNMLATPDGQICQKIWQFSDLWTVDEYCTAATQLGFRQVKLIDWSKPVTDMSHKRMQSLVQAANKPSLRQFFCKIHPLLNYFSEQDWQTALRCSNAHLPMMEASFYMALVLEKP
jgi:MPBQ/MSBQ methyltransferase